MEIDLSEINKILYGRIDPKIYAFKLDEIKNALKVGDTYRNIDIRLNEWTRDYPGLKKVYEESAVFKSNNEDIYFRDYSVHKYLKDTLKKKPIAKEIFLSLGLKKESIEFFEDIKNDDINNAIEDIKYKYIHNLPNNYDYYKLKELENEKYVMKKTNYTFPSKGLLDFRREQKDVVKVFLKAKEENKHNMLLYAVMRFGKTVTALQCAKKMNAKVVVVLCGKADVEVEWKEAVESWDDFNKDYKFITARNLKNNPDVIKQLTDTGMGLVLFLTLHDLQGKEIKEKHKELFDKSTKIDLVIVDETHYGARADKYGEALKDSYQVNELNYNLNESEDMSKEDKQINEYFNEVKRFSPDVIKLHLSGTPYRILMGDEFKRKDGAIIGFYPFSYIVEAKKKFKEKYPNKPEYENPYFGFPELIRFAMHPNKSSIKKLEELRSNGYTYAFSELFKTINTHDNKDGQNRKFVYEEEVLELFKVIDGSKSDSNLLSFLDYDKIKKGNMCRHIVCVLPYRASCDALESLLSSDNNKSKFKNLCNYSILNISGFDRPKEFEKSLNVKQKISECEENNIKTITLTVNKMLTGSTVKEWDTMLYFKDTSSPQEYDQAIFRIQNSYIKEIENVSNGEVIKKDMKPQTIFVDFDPGRMFSMQEDKALIFDPKNKTKADVQYKKNIENNLKISPIIIKNQDKFCQVNAEDIMKHISKYSINKGIFEETNEIPIDMQLLESNDLVKNAIISQPEIGSGNSFTMSPYDGEEKELDTDDLSSEKGLSSASSSEEKDSKTKEPDIRKQYRTYYAKILFLAFLIKNSNNSIISLDGLIKHCSSAENKRIMTNLGLNIDVLTEIKNHINPSIIIKLNHKIENMVYLSSEKPDSTDKIIDIAYTAINKFDKLSEAEFVTPKFICKKMVDAIPKKALIDIYNNNGRILDWGSKIAEFALAIYNRMVNELKINPDKVKNCIYSIPTSPIAYEFTKKMYEYLGLNIDNIAKNFYTNDLVYLKDNYDKLNKLLLQDKKFSTITLKDDETEIKKIMKFNVIVGNPPYQSNVGNKTSNKALSKQLYPVFMMETIKLQPDYICLLTPTRWFTGFGQDRSFPKLREFMKEHNHISKIVQFCDNKNIFSNSVGTVNYYLYDKNYTGDVNFYEIHKDYEDKMQRPLFEEDLDEILPMNYMRKYIKKITSRDDFVSINKYTTPRDPFKINSTNKVLKNILSDKQDSNHNLPIICAYGEKKFISDKYIGDNLELSKKYKVFTSKMNGGAGTLLHDSEVAILGKSFVGEPNSICSGALIAIGKFDKKIEAINLKKYMNTKFFRFMVGIMKSSQALYQNVYKYVPNQDFTSDTNNQLNWHVDVEDENDPKWQETIDDIDEQLFKKYGLNENGMDEFIKKKIKNL